MIGMDLRVEIANAVDGLVDLGVNIKTAMVAVLGALATAGRNRARANMYGQLGGTARWLEKHIYGRRRSETHAVIAAPRHIAEILEKGGTIYARKHKYLTFKVNGEWKKMRSVKIPARHWFTEAMEGFEESGVYNAAIDKGVKKATDKFNANRGLLG